MKSMRHRQRTVWCNKVKCSEWREICRRAHNISWTCTAKIKYRGPRLSLWYPIKAITLTKMHKKVTNIRPYWPGKQHTHKNIIKASTDTPKNIKYKFSRFYLFYWSTSAVQTDEWGVQRRSQLFSVEKKIKNLLLHETCFIQWQMYNQAKHLTRDTHVLGYW